MPKTETENKPKPDHVRDGVISLTIWHNKSSKGFPFDTYTPQRSYRDSNNQWKNTESFRRGDLLKLARLCEKAYDISTQNEEVDENG